MIKIYGRPNCGFCDRAKKLAQLHHLPHEYIDIQESAEAAAEFKNKFPDARSVPQIEWAGRHVGGYSEFHQEVENTRTYGQEAL
jgi:glutaredoxin 1